MLIANMLASLAPSTALTLAFFVAGVILGSFGMVVVARLQQKKPPYGRSRCDSCHKILQAFELIPILSFVLQQGRCKACHERIPIYHLIGEVLSGCVFVIALFLQYPSIIPAIILGLALWVFVLIAVIDSRSGGVPDILSFTFIGLAVLFSVLYGSFSVQGMAAGGGFFLLLWALGRGQWMGSADILIGLGVGALIGDWQQVMIWIAVTYIVGAVIAVVLLLSGLKKRRDRVPFAPFMLTGLLIYLIAIERVSLLGFY